MSERSPFFSIVIPTTRPHYLMYSLASVLAQTFHDFEVIIAFNQVPGGAGLGTLPEDPRIKLIEAPRFLIMYDNWEHGFRHARGQWRMLLGDDDCLVPQALALIARALTKVPDAQVMLWRWGGFTSADWVSAERAGRAHIPPYSGRVETRTSVDVARLMYRLDPDRTGELKQWLPSVMRGAVRADIVEEAWARVGAFCCPLSPDYGAAAQIVALVEKVHLLDLPLVILNHTNDSMVASVQGQTNTKAVHFYDMLDDPVFHHTLVQTRYESNRPAICETLMRVREKYPELRGQIPFHVIDFLEWHFVGLLETEVRGTEISGALDELAAVAADLPEVERTEFERRMKARRIAAASILRRPSLAARLRHVLVQAAVDLPWRKKILGRLAPRFGIDIDATKGNLPTIADFAVFVGAVFDETECVGALS